MSGLQRPRFEVLADTEALHAARHGRGIGNPNVFTALRAHAHTSSSRISENS
jgi:hypothetical protein